MNDKTIIAFVFACAAQEAIAQDAAPTAIAVQQFAPATGINPFFTIEGAKLLPRLELALGLYSHLSDDPLVARPAEGTPGEEIRLIESQFGFNAIVSIGLHERFELGFDLPITAFQRGDSPAALNNAALPEDLKAGGLGDLRIVPKILIWGNADKVSIIGAPVFTLPTGDKSAFLGEQFTFRPSLIGAYHHAKGYDFAANIAWKIRQPTTIATTTLDDQFAIGLGAHIPLKTKTPLGVITELTSSIGNSSQTSPTEARVGVRAQLLESLSVSGGLGTGLFTEGIGAPDVRVFASLLWIESGDGDDDKDGVINKSDQCQEDPEDRDQFQDDDGCPDPDNDNDNVLDASDECLMVQGSEANKGCPVPDQDNDTILDNVDQCVEKPEDKDNFQDEDGCPDLDNDQDKILDVSDKCPTEAEDADQFEDEDGCPELDNDKDNITDIFDKCATIAEDKDGFEDEDGCPDLDNDQDGIADATDKCPNEKETFNGDADDDGCADTAETAKLTGTKIEILEKVLFATNSDIIDPGSYKLLDGVAALLKLHPEITLMRVEGHTDNKGTRSKNIDLSNRRAAAVVKYLTDLSGIETSRLVYKGYGPDLPAQDNKTNEGRTANRRVEFVILDKDGVRIAPPDPPEPVVEPKNTTKKDPATKPAKDPKKDPKKDPAKDPKKDPKKEPDGPKRR